MTILKDDNKIPPLLLSVCALVLILGHVAPTAVAYNEPWSSAGIGRPEVTRRAIAGIWKVTPKALIQLPMKEFPV